MRHKWKDRNSFLIRFSSVTKKTAVLENAERREARLEKEKVAEKAEVKRWNPWKIGES